MIQWFCPIHQSHDQSLLAKKLKNKKEKKNGANSPEKCARSSGSMRTTNANILSDEYAIYNRQMKIINWSVWPYSQFLMLGTKKLLMNINIASARVCVCVWLFVLCTLVAMYDSRRSTTTCRWISINYNFDLLIIKSAQYEMHTQRTQLHDSLCLSLRSLLLWTKRKTNRNLNNRDEQPFIRDLNETDLWVNDLLAMPKECRTETCSLTPY